MMLTCGIPGVEMLGTEEDWLKLLSKLEALHTLLKPIKSDLGLSHEWWSVVKEVFEKLLASYRGNPDRDWWSRIVIPMKALDQDQVATLPGLQNSWKCRTSRRSLMNSPAGWSLYHSPSLIHLVSKIQRHWLLDVWVLPYTKMVQMKYHQLNRSRDGHCCCLKIHHSMLIGSDFYNITKDSVILFT